MLLPTGYYRKYPNIWSMYLNAILIQFETIKIWHDEILCLFSSWRGKGQSCWMFERTGQYFKILYWLEKKRLIRRFLLMYLLMYLHSAMMGDNVHISKLRSTALQTIADLPSCWLASSPADSRPQQHVFPCVPRGWDSAWTHL